ncbi:transposase [Arthrobacter sp. GCM10027362]|uniref:transposase n=1 Tax=Arthrobacter sp. GCM10027362 TaxID=3273379 RepID=UPI003631A9B8
MVGRGELTGRAWARIEPLLPSSGRGGQWRDHRQVINAILFKLRTGAPWRDLPERRGPWKTAHERLRKWTLDGNSDRLPALLGYEGPAGRAGARCRAGYCLLVGYGHNLKICRTAAAQGQAVGELHRQAFMPDVRRPGQAWRRLPTGSTDSEPPVEGHPAACRP